MAKRHGIPSLLLILGAGLLSGCAPAIVGILLATASSKGGGGFSTPPSVAAAVQSGNSGTISFDFTLVGPANGVASVDIQRSVDPNDDSTKKFPNTATGTFTRLSDGQVLPGNALTTSQAGVDYRFSWDTATDVGAHRVDAARLQIVLGSSIAFTTATFVVDNTLAPLVLSAVLGQLPAGASVYADEQSSTSPSDPGFIPLPITLADADSSPITLSVLYSTDGGVTFPPTNVAAGQVFDGSGNNVPPNAIPTSPGGINYTFHFQSTANALGSGGPEQIVLQFTPHTTKDGAPRATTVFTIDNAPFSASVSTPSGTQITDKVILPFAAIDAATPSAGLDALFEVSLQGGAAGTFFPATGISEPPAPAQGFMALPANSQGIQYSFVWNAFTDMVSAAAVPVFDATNVVLQVLVRRPSTQVIHGPFNTLFINVDQRLIHTVFATSPGLIHNGVPGPTESLEAPSNPAFAGNKVYFVDQGTLRVRSIDLATGLIDTAAGGGTQTSDGVLATDYKFYFGPTGEDAQGLAASAVGFGALFVATEIVGVPGTRIVRVDLSTPSQVRTIATGAGGIIDVKYEPRNDKVYYIERGSGTLLKQISANPAPGELPVLVAGNNSGGTTPDDVNPVSPPTSAHLEAKRCDANFSIPGFDGIVVLSQSDIEPRLLAVNFNANPVTIANVIVAPNSVRSIVPPAKLPAMPDQVSIGADGIIRFNAQAIGEVFGVDPTGAVTSDAGNGILEVSGDGGPATQAGIGAPSGVCTTTGSGFIITDGGFRRVREVLPNGIIETLAGNDNGFNGDGNPAIFSQIRLAFGVSPIGSNIISTDLVPRVIDRASTTISSVSSQLNLSLIGTPLVVGPDIYIATFIQNAITRLNANGTIDLIAGTPGVPGFTLAPTPALQAHLAQPQMLCMVGTCLVIAEDPHIVNAVNIGSVPQNCMGVLVQPGQVVDVAGNPTLPVVPPTNNVQATSVYLQDPVCAVSVADGSVYIVDRDWNAVFKVDTTGNLTIVTGTPGAPGSFSGDGGPASGATISRATGIGLSLDEKVLYIRDGSNSRIRAINLSGGSVTVQNVTIAPGNIATICGNGAMAQSAEEGSGLPALSSPLNLNGSNGSTFVCDELGNVFFYASAVIKYVDAAGILRIYGAYTIDGDGLSADNAAMTRPTALAVRADGSYAICDLGRIRYVPAATNTVTRIAGTGQEHSRGDGGPALNASFNFALTASQSNDVVTDGNGPRQMVFADTGLVTSLLLVADTLGNRIRAVNVGTTAYVGTAVTIPPGGIDAVGRPFASPEGVAYRPNGLVFIAETGANRIAMLNLSAAPIVYAGITILPGATQTLLTGLDAPRNVVCQGLTGFLLFQQGGNSLSPRITVFNPKGVTLAAYGASVPGLGSATVPTSIGLLDVPRGIDVDQNSADLYYAVRAGTSTGVHSVFRVAYSGVGETRVAGDGTGVPGFSGDGAIAISAKLNSPFSIGVDANGVLSILDGVNLRVRRCRTP
jgi:hypothetical protein